MPKACYPLFMSKVEVDLSPDSLEFVRSLVVTGEYESESAVIREALRRLGDGGRRHKPRTKAESVDIDWSELPSTDYDARLRRAFLARLVERESPFGTGAVCSALEALAARYDPPAEDLRQKVDEFRRKRSELVEAREREKYNDVLQQARRDVLRGT